MNQYIHDNRPLHVIIKSEAMWRTLALISSTAFVIVALVSAVERLAQ